MVKPRILIFGEIGTELVLKTSELPAPGQTRRGEDFYEIPGGSGLFTAVGLARIGADPVMAGRLGDDVRAGQLSEFMTQESVDVRFLSRTRNGSTGLSVRMGQPGAKDRILTFPGAGERFSESDVEDAFICYPDAVVLTRGVPPHTASDIIRRCRSRNLPLFLADLPDRTGDPGRRIASCEVLIASEEDALAMTGIRPSDQEKCMKACLALSSQITAKYVVLRLGERGCFLFDGLYYHFFPAFDVPQPAGVSSVDAFTAAFVFAYQRTEGDAKRAAEFAVIVSAVFLTRGGGLRGFPTYEEVRRFITRNEIECELP